MTASDAYWQEPFEYLMTADTYDRDAVMEAAQIMRNEILDLNAELTALRSAEKWRGIESAPRDGADLLENPQPADGGE